MTEKEIQTEVLERMQNALNHIQEKLKKVRTGIAHASLVEGVKVSCYGGEQELKHMASISCPDARSILIAPWDQSLLKNTAAALVKNDLGVAPLVEQRAVRLKIPELTEDKKQELIRAFKKEVEKTRVEFRQIRRMMNDQVRKALKAKDIGEDTAKDYENLIQEAADRFIKEVNELSEKKQQELIRV